MGGTGEFDAPSQWFNGQNTMRAPPPGSGDEAAFFYPGEATGAGSVADILVEDLFGNPVNVTFNGDINVAATGPFGIGGVYVGSNCSLTIAGGVLDTLGGITSYGPVTLDAGAEIEGGGVNAYSSLDDEGGILNVSSLFAQETVTFAAGAAVTVTGNAEFGLASAATTVNVSGGSTLSSMNGQVDGSPAAPTQMTLSGAGVSWTIGADLEVASNGQASLTVTGGAVLSDAYGDVADGQQGPNGTGSVTIQNGSTWTTSANLSVGFGATGTVLVESGSTLTSATAYLGRYPNGNGTVTITGAGSEWTNSGSITVGGAGTGTINVTSSGSLSVEGTLNVGWQDDLPAISGTGTVSVSGGGTITADAGDLGGFAGSVGSVSVSGTNSSFAVTDTLIVADAGTGTFSIASGASGTAANILVSNTAGAIGAITVAGTDTSLTTTETLTIGEAGTGSITVGSGASLSAESIIAADQATGGTSANPSALTLSGSSSATVSGEFKLGEFGTANLAISQGSNLDITGGTDSELLVGDQSGAYGSVTLTGTDTSLDVNGAATFGETGQGDLTLSGGAAITITGTLEEGSKQGGSGIDMIQGPTTSLDLKAAWEIGGAGTHDDTISAGATVSVDDEITLGGSANGVGFLTLTGTDTTLTAGSGDVTIGEEGTGTLSIQSGATFDAHAVSVELAGSVGSHAILTLSGDGSNLSAQSVTVGSGGTGALDVQADTTLISSQDLTLGETNGSNGSGTIEPDALVSLGTGLTVGGGGSGTLMVNQGTLLIASGDVTVGDEETGTGDFTVNDTSLDVPGTLSVGEDGNGAFVAGAGAAVTAQVIEIGSGSSGAGVFTASGSGTTVQSSGDTTVGSDGQGTLTVTSGAVLTTQGNVSIAEHPSGTASQAEVQDQGTWSILNDLNVGDAGAGELTIQSGGSVANNGEVTIGGSAASVGFVQVTGTLAQDGGTSVASSLSFGSGLKIGDAGHGTLVISGGAVVGPVAAGTGTIEIAAGISSAGTVTLDGSSSMLEGKDLYVGGSDHAAGGTGGLAISNGGVVAVSQITVWSTGNIAGAGEVTGTITDAGIITAQGGTLTLDAAVSGAGNLAIGAGATLRLGAADNGAPVTFQAGNAVLSLAGSFASTVTIDGFVASDTIDVAAASGGTIALGTGPSGVTATLSAGGDTVGSLFFAGLTDPDNIQFDAADGVITTVPCFVAGTRIRTPRGAIPIEELRAGDRVDTWFTSAGRPVRWLGHRRVDCRRHPEPRKVWPVCIPAGSFGAGLPVSDLLLSPDHALFVDGVLVPARLLIGHGAVHQRETAAVHYFHLELDRHDVVFAEGVPAESYLDTGDRAQFANGGPVVTLYPDFASREWEAEGCAPLRLVGQEVAAIRSLLDGRAPTLGLIRWAFRQ